jgi:hypothetical protein
MTSPRREFLTALFRMLDGKAVAEQIAQESNNLTQT